MRRKLWKWFYSTPDSFQKVYNVFEKVSFCFLIIVLVIAARIFSYWLVAYIFGLLGR